MESSNIPEKLMEEVWRYAKKPLISVGGKGATIKHGNNLRQLLDDHTVVKVKVNTKSFGKSRDISRRCRKNLCDM
jgi:RNA-binding protein YhbY